MKDTQSERNYLSTFSDFEYEGQATCNFENGLSENVKFSIRLLGNGRIIGDLQFITLHSGEILQYCKELRMFTLEGILKDSNIAIQAKECYLTNLPLKMRFTRNTITQSASATFSSQKVIFHPESESSIPKNEILVHFGILNVYETRIVEVNTSIGELEFGPYYDLKESTDVMSLFGVPLITSSIRLTIQPVGSKLDVIINESIKVVNNFLKVTSLSQTVWHDWAFFIIFEKEDNSERYRQIYRQLRSPKIKIPTSRQLYVDSGSFVKTAWEGYTEDLEEKYGFSLALELYIESNTSGTLETQFLNAATSLELLMDKFHKQRGTDMLFDDDTSFENFRIAMKNCARPLLKETGFDEARRAAVYNAMTAMKRRSFLDKCDMLLKYWGISYSDLGINLTQIVETRNKITHEGRYSDRYDNEILSYLSKTYNGLFNILARVFLAMLKYRGQYFDAPNSRWINFADVCSKIGSPGP